MATTRKAKYPRHSQFEHQRPLRIVDLHTAPRIASTVSPKLTYRGGPLLTNVQVFAIFWGNAWSNPANSPLLTHMNEFFDFILTSKLIDQLSEYSVPGQSIGHGTRKGSTVFTTRSPANR